MFFYILPIIGFAQEQGGGSTAEQEASFDYVYNQKSAEFVADLNNIGFDSLYKSNKEFHDFIKWELKYTEELFPHYNFMEAYKIDQQYFQNIDNYPVADEDCQWRELGPLNDHDWDHGVNSNNSNGRGIGPMNFLSFDPNFENSQLMFTGGWGSGLFYSENGGESWINGGTDKLPPPVSASDCQSSPFNSSTWFLTTGAGDGYFTNDRRPTGLYRTMDKGETWEMIGRPLDLGGQTEDGYNYWGWALKRVLINPGSTEQNLTLFTTGSRGIYRAENAMATVGENGETSNMGWENVYPENQEETITNNGEIYNLNKNWSYDIAYKQNPDGTYDTGHLFATGTKRYKNGDNNLDKGYILHSTDNGITWNELIPFDNDTNLFKFQRFIVRTTMDDPETIYFVGLDVVDVTNSKVFCGGWTYKHLFHLFKFDMGSETWETIKVKGWGLWQAPAFDISPLDKMSMHSADCIFANYSTDGGATWPNQSSKSSDLHADVEEIQFQPDGQKVWYAHHGGISSFDPVTESWTPHLLGLNGAEVIGFSTSQQNPDRINIGLYHTGSMVSGGGYNSETPLKWKQVKGGDGEEALIDFENDSISYVSAQFGSFSRNEDGWLTGGTGLNIPGKGHVYAAFEANEFEPQILYTASGGKPLGLLDSVIVYRHTNRGVDPDNNDDFHGWEAISTDNTFPNTGNVFRLHTSATDKNLLFALVLFDGNTTRKVYGNNRAAFPSSSTAGAWFEIPEIPNHANHWAPDIVSDPDDVNIFFVLHGSADLQNNNTGYKIAKYTYLGDNIITDLASDIDPGNFSIADLTFNLPNIHVSKLVIVPGTREYYISTDFDVWFTDQDKIDDAANNPDVWERIGTNLPHVRVSGMEIGYRYNLIRVGLDGRGVWEHCLPCNVKTGEVVIDEDKTIGIFARYNRNIRITNNSTVTITGEVQMVEGTSITIEPGSRLIIDGGTITNACGGLWKGIYVEGITSETQTVDGGFNNNTMGLLALINGAVIKNAQIAVRNYGVLANGDTDASKRGGVIKAKKSYFINNVVDVDFQPYMKFKTNGSPIADKSLFWGCDFIDNVVFMAGETPETTMKLDRVQLIDIKGCTFSDNRSNLLFDNYKTEDPGPVNSPGIGIESFGATFIIDTYDTGTDSITGFNNLQYAIRAFKAENLKAPPTGIEIENAIFNSFEGIYLNGIDDVVIKNNNFLVNSDYTTTGEEDLHPYGLYLDMCNNYKVEENTFNSDASGEGSGAAFGIVVNNRHGGAEKLNNNIFDNFYTATEAVGQNKSENPLFDIGLQILCNNYSNGVYDIAVLPDYDNLGQVVGIAYEQGEMSSETEKLAGNLFGINSSQLESNYLNKGDNIVYFHHNFFTENRVRPMEYSKESITLQAINVDYNPDESCPIKDSDSGDDDDDTGGRKEQRIAELKTTVEQSTAEVNEIDYQLSTLVDGGNTSQMENDVVLTDNADAWRKYQQLMASAGYLSEEVLDEVSKKETGFNKAMVRNVLVANPQAAKSETIQQNLDNRGDQLPNYMRDQIDLGLTKLSSKEYLDLAKANLQTIHHRSINELVMLLKSDTANDRSAEIVAALSNTGDVAFDYQLVGFYDSHGLFNLSDALLDVINGASLTENQQEFYTSYSGFRNLTLGWEQNETDMSALDTEKLMQLQNYAVLNSTVAVRAIGLQQLNGVYSYFEPVYTPEGGEKSNRTARRKKRFINDNNLLLFPNPADGFFTVEYQLTDAFNSAQLIVFDINGKLIGNYELHYDIDQIIISSENWPSGQYTVSILADGKTILHKMITLIK